MVKKVSVHKPVPIVNTYNLKFNKKNNYLLDNFTIDNNKIIF